MIHAGSNARRGWFAGNAASTLRDVLLDRHGEDPRARSPTTSANARPRFSSAVSVAGSPTKSARGSMREDPVAGYGTTREQPRRRAPRTRARSSCSSIAAPPRIYRGESAYRPRPAAYRPSSSLSPSQRPFAHLPCWRMAHTTPAAWRGRRTTWASETGPASRPRLAACRPSSKPLASSKEQTRPSLYSAVARRAAFRARRGT